MHARHIRKRRNVDRQIIRIEDLDLGDPLSCDKAVCQAALLRHTSDELRACGRTRRSSVGKRGMGRERI
eukprot:6188011-Pleurochrysis_carterae.AAC.2